MRKVDDEGKNILFRGAICCSGGLHAVQEGYMMFRRVIWMPRRVVYCSGGLYAVQRGYMLFRRVILGVGYCSGGLYAVQVGYMLLRRVIWMFSKRVYCSGGYMLFR